MMQTLRRQASIYGAIAASIPKQYLAFRLWFWVGLVLGVIEMSILVFFWRAVYARNTTIAGLDSQTTLTYILLAHVFSPLTDQHLIWDFGTNLREGRIAHLLLRPIGFQTGYYVEAWSALLVQLIMNI